MALDLTRLSQKGQVVIPNTLRKELGLKEGTKFLVMGVGDTIVLRRLEITQERKRLRELLEESRKKAERFGLTEREVEELIRRARKP